MKKLIVLGLIFLSCATTGMQRQEKEAPIKIKINALKNKVYQVTAERLLDYGFEIESSDPVLGRLTTDYADFNVGIVGEALLDVLIGVKDFRISITTMIADHDSTSTLILRGIGEYSVSENVFKKSYKRQPVRKGTKAYEQLILFAEEVKNICEGRKIFIDTTKEQLESKSDYIPEGFEVVSKYLKGLTIVYSVSVDDTNWAVMKMYGNYQPHAEGGNTIILFFNDIQNTPDISQTGVHFDEKYNSNLIAAYYRYPNGNDRLIKYPRGKK